VRRRVWRRRRRRRRAQGVPGSRRRCQLSPPASARCASPAPRRAREARRGARRFAAQGGRAAGGRRTSFLPRGLLLCEICRSGCAHGRRVRRLGGGCRGSTDGGGAKRSTLSSSDRLAQHEASAPILARCACNAAPNAQHQTPETHSFAQRPAPCARPDRAPPGLLGGVTLPAPAGAFRGAELQNHAAD